MKKGLLGVGLLWVATICLGETTAPLPVGGLFTVPKAVGGETLTVSQAVQTALTGNYQILNAHRTKGIYEAQLKEAVSYFFPSFSLEASYLRTFKKNQISFGEPRPPGFPDRMELGKNNAYMAGAKIAYILWAGGSVRNRARLAQTGVETGVYNLLYVQEIIRKQVFTFCYDIIYASAFLRIQENYLAIAKQHLTEAQIKYKQGLASNLEVLNQKVKVENIEPLLLQAQKNVELGTLHLRNILNRDTEEPLFLTWSEQDLLLPEVPSLSVLYEKAQKNRADLKLMQLQAEAARYQIALEKAARFPEISLFGDYSYNGATTRGFPQHKGDSYWTAQAGISFRLPLFEGGRLSASILQKELAYEQAVETYQNKIREVRLTVKEAWLLLEEARARVKATQGVVEEAQQNLKAQLLRYREGLCSQLELNDATHNVNTSSLQYVQAVYDGMVALAELRFAVGSGGVEYEEKKKP